MSTAVAAGWTTVTRETAENFIDDEAAERNLPQPGVHRRNDLAFRPPPLCRLLFSLSPSVSFPLVIDLEPSCQCAAEGTGRFWPGDTTHAPCSRNDRPTPSVMLWSKCQFHDEPTDRSYGRQVC